MIIFWILCFIIFIINFNIYFIKGFIIGIWIRIFNIIVIINRINWTEIKKIINFIIWYCYINIPVIFSVFIIYIIDSIIFIFTMFNFIKIIYIIKNFINIFFTLIILIYFRIIINYMNYIFIRNIIIYNKIFNIISNIVNTT